MGVGFSIQSPQVGDSLIADLTGKVRIVVTNTDTVLNVGFQATIENIGANMPMSSPTQLSDVSGNQTRYEGMVSAGLLPASIPMSSNKTVFVEAHLANGTFSLFDANDFKAHQPGSFEGGPVLALAGKLQEKAARPLPRTLKIEAPAPSRSTRGQKEKPAPKKENAKPTRKKTGTPDKAKPSEVKPAKKTETPKSPKRTKPADKPSGKPAKPKQPPASKPAPKRTAKPSEQPPTPERRQKPKPQPRKPAKKPKGKPKKPSALLRYCDMPQFANCWLSAPADDADRKGAMPSYWLLRRADTATWELTLRRGNIQVAHYLAHADESRGLTLPNLFRLAASEDSTWPDSIHLMPAL